MKTKILTLFTIAIIMVLSSCDPVASLEANIENLSDQNVTVEFVSFDESLNKTLEISVNEIVLFQEGMDIGNTFIEPSLMEFDSVVIRNRAEEILKIYKPGDTGRNIYNIKEAWTSSEPSKRFFKYEFEIANGDVE